MLPEQSPKETVSDYYVVTVPVTTGELRVLDQRAAAQKVASIYLLKSIVEDGLKNGLQHTDSHTVIPADTEYTFLDLRYNNSKIQQRLAQVAGSNNLTITDLLRLIVAPTLQ